MTPLPPYLDKLSDWKTLLSNKYLIFDADAIISTIDYRATSLCDEMKKVDVQFCIIDPIYVELLRTNDPGKRTERQEFITKYKFVTLPLTANELSKSRDIQIYLQSKNIHTASISDLYLAGTMFTVGESNTFLFTGNLRDFPHPLFQRKGAIIFQNDNNCVTKSILASNRMEINLNN